MRGKEKRWTPPLDPVYKAGKRKEHASKAIRAIEAVRKDIEDSVIKHPVKSSVYAAIDELLPKLKNYRALLDE
jgi:hypothetical protein